MTPKAAYNASSLGRPGETNLGEKAECRLVDDLAEIDTVAISSKVQVTIPSKIRKQLGIGKGERLLVAREQNAIMLIPIPNLSELACVDEELFTGRRPSGDQKGVDQETALPSGNLDRMYLYLSFRA